MTARSRLPDTKGMTREMIAFLDNLDKKQQSVSQIQQLDGSESLTDVIAKLNTILSSQS